MISPVVLVPVGGSEGAMPQAFRPVLPRLPPAFSYGAKGCIALEVRLTRHERLESVPPIGRWLSEEARGQLLEDSPLQRHQPAVIHLREPAQGFQLPAKVRGFQKPLRFRKIGRASCRERV